MTEDDTYKVLCRKISYSKMKDIITHIRYLYINEPYQKTDFYVRSALKEYGWDYVDFFMGGRYD